MNQSLHDLLNRYRQVSKTEREKGKYFEDLIKAFLKNDPVYTDQFSDVWTYSDWAEAYDWDKRDVGIDLVAKLRDEEGYCAIQCKFYDEEYRIQKKDIDSFFTASGKAPFTRRLIVDTTRKAWSEHASNALIGQTIETNYIQLNDLEQSPIDWGVYAREQKVELRKKKTLMPHQQKALSEVQSGLTESDRGKLIMACGTGKTFTSLKIAETIAGKGKRILYLVPSLALMSQTIREWTNDAEIPLHSFAVCSDVQVGKRKAKDDLSDINIHDLAYPATTNPVKLADKLTSVANRDDEMTVVFSTYQSINVISDAQLKHGLPEFDLIICDEAHRTTGVTLADEDDSNFVRVHHQDYIKGKKRLYMTATPRIFGDAVKTKASEVDAVLCSMDDPNLFGETLYEVTFSYAVENELLTDYKVIVLAVDEEAISTSVQKRLTDIDSQLVLDDVTKIIGCYRALSKLDFKAELMTDSEPMKRAVAFCRDIKSSKLIKKEFAEVVEEYLDQQDDNQNMLRCEVDHVDGTYNAKERNILLDWLSEDTDPHTCRILSNARCLSEGVDVPALDAIMFLHPRKSQIDVVQSVGRVMRRAEGKKMGYVILPVGIPSGITAEEALNNNEKYRVVWQILNALRSHDDRFDSLINKIEYGVDYGKRIEIIIHDFPNRAKKKDEGAGIGEGAAGDDGESDPSRTEDSTQLPLALDEFSKAILARIVKKCGTREYWEDWANDIAKIAQTHITRITALLKASGTKERKAFDDFLDEIRDDLNESITEADAIEMLAQHIITRPVFEALFKNYSFAKNNPVSIAMQKVLDALQEQQLDNENKSLEKFYQSVHMRAEGINDDSAKQKIIVQLYDKFFKNAFPRMTDRLGIVYTPVEVVDFIIHSINDVLQSEFGESLGSKGVHILDPFTGTGTFITRLLQSGVIKSDELEYKYKNEIHANEIVLLAYYIAAINIEAAYHGLVGGEYEPFEGICLTDTFQLYEKEDMVSRLLVDNTSRRQRQKALDIRVIMGNPPYSAGQSSANDNNANVDYPSLDGEIRNSYAKFSTATNKNALYNSYIRAFRWATDRVGERGVVGFVTNAGWIDGNVTDGMRKCLEEEFSNIYVFHLRGNARTSGDIRRKEKDNVFGQGTRTPIAISILVKNPDSKDYGRIYFHDIGDYLTREEKLSIISDFESIKKLEEKVGWQEIIPNKHYDWINQRDENFDFFMAIGGKKTGNEDNVFSFYTPGIMTSRDAWCYNASKIEVDANMRRMINYFNLEVDNFVKEYSKNPDIRVEDVVSMDSTKISWSHSLREDVMAVKKHTFNPDSLRLGIYRPFTLQWLYLNKSFNESMGQSLKFFPRVDIKNLVITISGKGTTGGLSSLMVAYPPCYDLVNKSQCFPLKTYEKKETVDEDLFLYQSLEDGYQLNDGITDEALEHFTSAYPAETISKEDIFYYIYGLLHSEDYRERYADNLSKQLPRIPCVKKASDFWAFTQAGRELAELHVNFEEVEMYPVTYKDKTLDLSRFTDIDFRVEKMRFGGKGKEKDKSTVIYNSKITMTNIPLEAYEYVVNGKPALEWVMERQSVSTDKASGIVNDANRYAIETVGDPAYPLKLFQRIITVSLETMKIVKSLPKLDIQEPQKKSA